MKVGGYKLSALEIESVLLEVCVSFIIIIIYFQLKDKKLNEKKKHQWYLCQIKFILSYFSVA